MGGAEYSIRLNHGIAAEGSSSPSPTPSSSLDFAALSYPATTQGDCRHVKDVLRFTIYVKDMAEFCVVYEGAEVLEVQGVIKILLKKNRWVARGW